MTARTVRALLPGSSRGARRRPGLERARRLEREGTWACSLHLDVLPEAEATGDLRLGRARRLVDPGGAGVAHAVDHHVVELDAVRAFEIALRLRRLGEPLHAHGGARKIPVAAVLDDVVALGDHMTVERCLHAAMLQAREVSNTTIL